MPNPVDLAYEPVALQGAADPGYDARDHRLAWARAPLQEGVANGTDFKVTQDTGANLDVSVAPGEAYVEGDSIVGQGRYYARLDAAQSDLTATAGDAANPRIDQVVLEIKDDAHDASGLNKARLRIIAGTPTAGATLDNRLGAAALPSSCLRLADVLMPTGTAAVTNANVRDRRPWARGAYVALNGPTGADYTKTTGAFTAVDAAGLSIRVELSGVPTRVQLNPRLVHSTAAAWASLHFQRNGVALDPSVRYNSFAGTGTGGVAAPWVWEGVPPAGSALIVPFWQTSANTLTMSRSATDVAPVLIVEELARQNAQNV